MVDFRICKSCSLQLDWLNILVIFFSLLKTSDIDKAAGKYYLGNDRYTGNQRVDSAKSGGTMTERWDLGCIQKGSEERKEYKHKLMGMYAELRVLQRGEADRGGQDRATDLPKWRAASRSGCAVLMT